jgi:hypothetical protein
MALSPFTRVLVVEQDGALTGAVCLVPMLHTEGLWLRDGRRGNPGVFRRLMQAVGLCARAAGETHVFPASDSDEMTALVMKLGAVEIPARWFALSVEAKCLSR